MQERAAALGTPVHSAPEFYLPRRGDLIFWKGHVAVARDHGSLIHANAFHMAVAVEPIADAIARIRAAGSEITSVRRTVP
jgi:cell wall-associated NlpC family hydrolase